MPSKEMRRSTRVFGARVLRSGRRLRTVPVKVKHVRTSYVEDWIKLLKNSGDGGGAIKCEKNQWLGDGDLKQQEAPVVVYKKLPKLGPGNSETSCLAANEMDETRMWGSVYQRKRKRARSGSLELSGKLEKNRTSEDKRYGKQFFRKQWRKKARQDDSQVHVRTQILTAVVDSSCGGNSWFACLIYSILRYMTRTKVKLLHLASFLLSKPVGQAFAYHGVHFLLDGTSIGRSGVCKIIGARCFIPLFSVDFSAVPICFTYLHSSLLLRYACFPHLPVEDDVLTDDDEISACLPVERSPYGSNSLATGDYNSPKRVEPFTVRAPKLARRTLRLRSSVSSRSIQKRRSSMITRRGRNPSAIGVRKANGGLISGFFGFSHHGIPFSPVSANGVLRSSVRKSSSANIKELKSTIVELTHDLESTSCSANILVIDSDMCYREEGAIITLEKAAPTQWFLVIKRNGIRRYSVRAQKAMRPGICNRVTHDIIWAADSGWKLEFPNRQDWLIFMELYRECSDRNVNVPSVDVISVPGVHEVPGFADSCIPFTRPTAYITLKDDEVARALAKRSANYDMDSDDEEWLCKFNKEFCADCEGHEAVSEEKFEFIIDNLEKGFYCNPEEYSDEKVANNICPDLERKEVLEAVHSYWTKKRKQKRSVLLRVFQCNQHRRPQLISKTVMRKKRSFKRQASQVGRGKQRTFLQAMVAEHNAIDEENASQKVQQAKASARRSEGLAIAKRQRAQLLMENADLATYKAMIALRIAEAARLAKSPDKVASLFPG